MIKKKTYCKSLQCYQLSCEIRAYSISYWVHCTNEWHVFVKPSNREGPPVFSRNNMYTLRQVMCCMLSRKIRSWIDGLIDWLTDWWIGWLNLLSVKRPRLMDWWIGFSNSFVQCNRFFIIIDHHQHLIRSHLAQAVAFVCVVVCRLLRRHGAYRAFRRA